jgi:hypothetical protein
VNTAAGSPALTTDCLAVIGAVLERSLEYICAQMDDLSDEELLMMPEGLPTSAAWTLGHLVHSLHEIEILLGATPWLSSEWERRFGFGSSPAVVASDGEINRADLLCALVTAGQRLRGALATARTDRLGAQLSGTTFDFPSEAILQIVCAHTAFHAGQLALIRRAMGHRPVGVFV